MIILLFILIITNCIMIYLLFQIKEFLFDRKEVEKNVEEYKEFYIEEKKPKINSFFNR